MSWKAGDCHPWHVSAKQVRSQRKWACRPWIQFRVTIRMHMYMTDQIIPSLEASNPFKKVLTSATPNLGVLR